MEGRASITSFKRVEALSMAGCLGCSDTGCSGIGCSGTGCSVVGCLFLLRWYGAMLYKPAVVALDILLLDVRLQSR